MTKESLNVLPDGAVCDSNSGENGLCVSGECVVEESVPVPPVICNRDPVDCGVGQFLDISRCRCVDHSPPCDEDSVEVSEPSPSADRVCKTPGPLTRRIRILFSLKFSSEVMESFRAGPFKLVVARMLQTPVSRVEMQSVTEDEALAWVVEGAWAKMTKRRALAPVSMTFLDVKADVSESTPHAFSTLGMFARLSQYYPGLVEVRLEASSSSRVSVGGSLEESMGMLSMTYIGIGAAAAAFVAIAVGFIMVLRNRRINAGRDAHTSKKEKTAVPVAEAVSVECVDVVVNPADLPACGEWRQATVAVAEGVKAYYYNVRTGVVCWERPEEALSPPQHVILPPSA